MAAKPPKPPNDVQNDAVGALEKALLEARSRVEEAVAGLRAVIRGRESRRLSDDSGRYIRKPRAAKPAAAAPDRKPKPR